MTNEQGQHIRLLRLELVIAKEDNDSESAYDIAQELAQYMRDQGLTGAQYAEWNRNNPRREAIRTTPDNFIMSLEQAFKDVN